MSKNKITEQKRSPTAGKLAIWLLAGAVLTAGGFVLIRQPVGAVDVIVYKSPTCGCCNDWVSHLQENGFSVKVHDQSNMNPIKSELGVPPRLQSCHTAKVGDYVIEGHVPAQEISRLLKEKPQIDGLAVPGMPMGSPGMEGSRKDAYDVLTFQENGKTTVYASY